MASRVDRIRELRRHLAASREAGGEKQNMEHLQNLTERLRGPVEGLENWSTRCRLLEVEIPQWNRENVLENLAKMRRELIETPDRVGQGKVFNQFRESVGSLNTKLRESADTAWGERKNEAEASVPDAMLAFWEAVPELSADAAAVRKAVSQIREQRQLPQGTEQLEDFLKACETIRERLVKLNQFEAPASVRAFLNAVRSSNGAPWALLTDEVLGWLKENQMLEQLRIRLG